VARLLVQEAVYANNKLPDPLPTPADLRDPFSDEDDREQGDSDRRVAAQLPILTLKILPTDTCMPEDCVASIAAFKHVFEAAWQYAHSFTAVSDMQVGIWL
jgi:hypothetical protein